MTTISIYAKIDPTIRAWVARNSLTLSTSQQAPEIRCIYVSSNAGECYQIWINRPVGDKVEIHAACVEGRRDTEEEPLQSWQVSISELDSALEEALESVVEWMKPSDRHYPKQ
jgi:hypothetical protein